MKTSTSSPRSSAVTFFIIAAIAIAFAGVILAKNSRLILKNEADDLLEVLDAGEEPKDGNYYKLTLYYQFGNYAEMQHKRNGITTGKDQYFVGLIEDGTVVSFKVKDKNVISKFKSLEDATYDYFEGKKDSTEGYQIELTGKWSKIGNSKIKSYYKDAIEQLGLPSTFKVDYVNCFDASQNRGSLITLVAIVGIIGIVCAILGVASIGQARSLEKQRAEIDNLTKNNQNPFLDNTMNNGYTSNENPFMDPYASNIENASNTENESIDFYSSNSSNTDNGYYNNNDNQF